MAKVEARKYSFKNITKDKTVHVKELRKAISPGREVEWEGILNPNTKRLVDQKLLEVKDLGPGDAGRRKNWVAESRARMSKQVQKILAKQHRRKSGGSAEPLKASEVDMPETALEPEPTPVVEPEPEPEPKSGLREKLDGAKDVAAPEEPASRLDSLVDGLGKKKRRKKKK